MKKKKVLFIMSIMVSLIFFSCSKDTTEPEPEIPTFEETGVVDEGGGIVHITDEESEIYGTYVEIPEGALDNSVEISIQQVEEFTFVDTTAIVIDFAPSGTQFSELIEIGIPYKENSDIENLQLYTYNEDDEAWEVMMIDHIDTQNKLIISKTNHFSLYTAGDYISIMFDASVYKTSNDKIGIHIQAPNFNEIPTRLAYWDDGFFNIEQCIDGDPFENFPKAWVRVTVIEDTWWFPETYSTKALYFDKYSQVTPYGNWKAEIKDQYGDDILHYNEWLDLNALSDFYSGLPYIIESESFDTSEDFVIIVEFYYSQYTDLSASSTLLGRYTPIFSFAIQDIDFNDLSNIPSTLDEDEDMITNDYDVPEAEPVVEIITPSGTQSNYITINYSISDEDGGLNEFGIYHQSNATGVQQAALISSSTGNIHNGSFIENIEPGPHSFTWDSSVVFSNSLDNVKMIFSWVDPVNGGMPGLTFESNYFEIDNTSTTNQPPSMPFDPSPAHEAVNVSINTYLSWDCTDPDPEDILTYDVYFGTSPNPPLENSGQSENIFDLNSLGYDIENETTYYWKIVAHDDHSNSTTGEIWEFTTAGDTEPPFIGNIYIPEPGTTVSGIVTIETYATDNVGVTQVVFEVFRNGIGYEQVGIDYTPDANEHFSIEFDSSLFGNGQHNIHATAYDVAGNSNMAGWAIIFDNNQPPNSPTNPTPSDNATEVSINIELSWDCTDPESDPLLYDVYFGTSSTPPLVNSGQSETTYDPGSLDFEETYYWKIVAHDDHSNSTTGDIWEFTTVSEGGYGTVTDIDGNVYQTLMIGDQEWMIENLKVTHYNNEDAIPHLTDNGDWTSTNSGAYCVYDNDPSNADTYGNLYNWYAVADARNIAPEGWRVPTDEEIMELEMYLGMSYSEAHDTGYRGTNEGSKLAGRADLWIDGALENDSEFGTSGFSALPGGYRSYFNGDYDGMPYYGSFWSSTVYYSDGAWYRLLYYNSSEVNRYYYNKQSGFSVRCVRD